MRLFLYLALLIGACLAPARAGEPVTLQLKWTHAFQFAGYYAAQQQGYYREAGLDVTLKPGYRDVDVIDEVVSGRAEFGVGTSALLLARNSGKPVVALAVIFQHSPMVLLATRHGAHQDLRDLVGKRIMVERQSDELLAYLRREGVPLASIVRLAHSFDAEGLIDGRADAISAYLTSETFTLDQVGFDYQVYSPRTAGIDFYGDNLFTTEAQIRRDPERVKAFRAASLRGWQYAMAHPDEIITLILKQYPQGNSRAALQYEAAQMVSLMRTDLIGVGYMNPGRWRHIADIYAEIAMLPADYPLDGFLYDANPERDLSRLYTVLVATVVMASLIGTAALYILRINRRLAQSLTEVRQTGLRLKVLSTAIDQSPTSILITGPDNVIEYVNPHFSKLTGYTPEEVIGQTPKISHSGLTDPAVYRAMWSCLERGEAWTGELANRRKSGELYWEEVHIAPVKDAAGKLIHYVAVKLDITERIEAHQRLTQMAHYDTLTHLPNRALFYERVTQGLALARRNGSELALMFIDLDRFKPINDEHGHAVGDLILQEAAARMSAGLRDADTVGRIGGDEFVVLLLDVQDEASAVMVANKIRAALNAPFEVAGKTLYISSSIGIALFSQSGGDEITLTKNADFAMYQAKAGGRDRVHVFKPGEPSRPA